MSNEEAKEDAAPGRRSSVRVTGMTSHLPLIRLSSINPFLMELRRRGIDARPILERIGLPADIPASPELFVAPRAIYRFVEDCAGAAGDRYLGHSIGSRFELANWDVMAVSIEQSRTVGELLTHFTLHSGEHSTATRFFVRTDGDRSTFGLMRVQPPEFDPGQNDAFYVGFISRLLRQAVGDQWDPARVVFEVAEPGCIPDEKQEYRIGKGGRTGVRVAFPTKWLFAPLDKSSFGARGTSVAGRAPVALLESVRSALGPHLSRCDLTVEVAAEICGYNRRRLARELRAKGTTLSREIAQLRLEKAQEELRNTTRQIAEIAESVGFSDPTVFSRAFKKWAGQSPQDYRRTHRAGSK